MKKYIMGALVALSLSLGACSSVPPGHEGVLVSRTGSDKGVNPQPVGVGYLWVGPLSDLYTFPTFSNNYCWTKGNDPKCGSPNNEEIIFQSAEGMAISSDIGISFQVIPGKTPVLFQKYRRGLDEITHSFLRMMVQSYVNDESSSHNVDSIYGNGKVAILKAVEKRIREELEPNGLKVEHLYWIGKMRLPEKVEAALDAKIAATQMAQQRQNEVQQAKYEVDKAYEKSAGEARAIETIAKAQAEANKILSQSLTPSLVQYKAIEKWDGILPRMSGNAVPFIEMKLDEQPKK